MEKFFPEEIEQLERGDIPYFFHYLGSKHIYYISNEKKPKATQFKWHDIFHREKKPKPSIQKGLVPLVEDVVIKHSVLQIARTFAPNEVNKVFGSGVIKVNYKNDDIFVEISNKWKLKCKRISG